MKAVKYCDKPARINAKVGVVGGRTADEADSFGKRLGHVPPLLNRTAKIEAK